MLPCSFSLSPWERAGVRELDLVAKRHLAASPLTQPSPSGRGSYDGGEF